MAAVSGIDVSLRLDDKDLTAMERLLERIEQGLKHLRWALTEYRKDLAANQDETCQCDGPIPREDLTL